jgi:cobalt-zinc-cadmium efflux system protein
MHSTHDHSHSHGGSGGYSRAFAVGIALNLLFVAVEVFYGLRANSSALLADAGHNAGDVLSLVFAWSAMILAEKSPGGRYTYGLRKTTILVSLLNALLLFAAAGVIGWDAVGKFGAPEPVAGPQVMIVAGVGVVINTLTALLLMRGQKEDLNIKGAFLHMAADAGVSLGVVMAGLLITVTGALWIDPVMSLMIIGIIVWGTWDLFTDSVDLALDAVPKHIDLRKVRQRLLQVQGVREVHDLHIWAMSTTRTALTAHVLAPDVQQDEMIRKINELLGREFGIYHTTLQIERGGPDVENRPGCSVCEEGEI